MDILVYLFTADAADWKGRSRGNMFIMYGQDKNIWQVFLGIIFIAAKETKNLETVIQIYWRTCLRFLGT